MNYSLIRTDRRTVAIRITPGGGVEVRAPKNLPIKVIEKFLGEKQGWIKKKQIELSEKREITLNKKQLKFLSKIAADKLPSRCEHFASLMGVCYSGIKITSAATRWGSCSGKNAICFSCRLMLMPEEAQDYVVVHELSHIIRKDHSKAFWKIVRSIMPDYMERKKLLKQGFNVDIYPELRELGDDNNSLSNK